METSIVGVGVNVTDRFRSIVEEKTTRIEHLATRAPALGVDRLERIIRVVIEESLDAATG